MPTITLPDNTSKVFDHPVTVIQVAESIGPGLAKAALAGEVDGKLVDTCVYLTTIQSSGLLRVKTRKEWKLSVIRSRI